MARDVLPGQADADERAAATGEARPLDATEVLARALVFSQSAPLDTSSFGDEAKKWGVELDPPTLRALYRQGYLSPLVEVTSRRVSKARAVEPRTSNSTNHLELQRALLAGRVRDLGAVEYRRNARFTGRRTIGNRVWWNGLLYSRWQLLAIPDLRLAIARAQHIGPYDRRWVKLPALPDWWPRSHSYWTRWALVLTALEARYLPQIRPRWIQLSTVDRAAWQDYCESFDPERAAAELCVTAHEVHGFADELMMRARRLDPNEGWWRLIRRANPSAWAGLKGDALAALDHRMAAEILIQFHEDVISSRSVNAVTIESARRWHWQTDRISYREDEALDQILGGLGLSPFPGVLLAVEGEVEAWVARRVLLHLHKLETPDLVQIVCMRTANKDLTLAAAAMVAPVLGERRGDTYDMLRPPTRLMVVVDRDQGWETPQKVANQRRKILDEINRVVRAQTGGAEMKSADLEDLVHIAQPSGRSFEFSHFSDHELAAGISAIAELPVGLTASSLVDLLGEARNRGHDVGAVWHKWPRQPSKLKLAQALWETLAAKIDGALRDETDAPEIAVFVDDAYHLAQRSTIGNFVIDVTGCP